MIDWLLNQLSWETIAVAAALAYVLLAAKENIWCWFFALISTAIYTLLFWNVSLLMESALNIYYLLMAVYGFSQWRKPDTKTCAGAETSRAIIHRWPIKYHLISIAGILIFSAVSGWLLSKYTAASLPYLDSLTTWAAVFTTWMVTRKVLENWLYWIVIDAISIYLYLSKDLYQTAILFILYVGIAAYGWYTWHKKLQTQEFTRQNI